MSGDSVSLVGGTTGQEGRLEVQYNGVHGTVCDDGFTDAAARVVCYSLGFGSVNTLNATRDNVIDVNMPATPLPQPIVIMPRGCA